MLENRIDRVTIRNYRSLKDVTVELADLTVLVGANGTGKSNFIDALAFVRDAHMNSLQAAMSDPDWRRSLGQIRHQADDGSLPDIGIYFNITLNNEPLTYGFTLESLTDTNYRVKEEKILTPHQKIEITDGNMSINGQPTEGRLSQDTLNLYFFSHYPMFSSTKSISELYDFLSEMRFYDITPDKISEPQKNLPPYPLYENGKNFASALSHLLNTLPTLNKDDFISTIKFLMPFLNTETPLEVKQASSNVMVLETHQAGGIFDSTQLSDGTLRTLALLVALYQQPFIPVIGFEEPELFINSGNLGMWRDEFQAASRRSQIILTTHSPDLIAGFGPENIRVVEMDEHGETRIGRLAKHQWNTIQENILNAGELLRVEGLRIE